MPLAAGTQLGHYEIISTLGAGGMGEVYRARQAGLGREVALKVLSPEFSSNAQRLARFEQEAKSASALNHPNIVTIYEIGNSGQTAYIAMELVEGKTLRGLLDGGQMPLKKILQVAAALAEGLSKAHAAGIVHRDLKPENVMVSRDGFVKILDFGLAKLAAQSNASGETLTRADLGTDPGTVMGTASYMSPEQARGGVVDFHSDQFSLGTVMYEMATGLRPFQRESAAQTMAAIIQEEPKPIAEMNAKVPAALRWIIERCLAKEPEERYASTRDLARDLEGVRDHLSELSGAAEVSLAATSHGRRRRWQPAFWLAAGLLGGWSAGFWLRPPTPPLPSIKTLTFSGSDLSPTASPDGHTVAFVSNRTGISRIWLKQFSGGAEAPLTSGPDSHPRFSRDGSALLFVRTENHGKSIYRVAVVGGEPQKVVDNANAADWSPDGKQIAFLRNESINGKLGTLIELSPAEGGASTEISRVDGTFTGEPRWSPDGRFIALVERTTGFVGNPHRKIILIPADGKPQHNLEAPTIGGELSGVAWVGDGSQLLYSQPTSVSAVGIGATTGANISASRIILQQTKSGVAKPLFNIQTSSSALDIVAPGSVVMDSINIRRNLKEATLATGAGGAGPEGRWLTRGSSIDRQPYYSPDGDWAVFTSNRSGNSDIWAISTKSGVVRKLTENDADDWDPTYSPDGKKLIWSSNRNGHFEIWMAEADGSGAHQVSNDGVDAENPTATRDGWILYISGNPAKLGLWKMRMDGSQATGIISGALGWPDCSPDGKFVLYHVFSGGGDPAALYTAAEIHVARIADGSPEPFQVHGTRARWMQNGHAIVFVQREGDASNLAEVNFVPGARSSGQRILIKGDPDRTIETFEVSPDGSRVLLSLSEGSQSLMLLEGLPEVKPAARPRQ